MNNIVVQKIIFLSIGLLFQATVAQAFINGQAASTVMNTGPEWACTTGPKGFCPGPVAYDVTNVAQPILFNVQSSNNRVLMFLPPLGAITTGMSATLVLGQPDFTTTAANLTRAGMNNPGSVAYDPVKQLVFVADSSNRRVLVYDLSNPANVFNGMDASLVLGQPDFTSANVSGGGLCNVFAGPPDALGMDGPGSVAFDSINRQLFVVDHCNNRVLVFDFTNYPALTSPVAATKVLGEATLTSSSGGTLADQLFGPEWVTYDSTHKWLMVSHHSGVVVYDLSNGLTSGMKASFILGEPGFGMTSWPTTQSGMGASEQTTYDAVNQRIFVADSQKNRILEYDVKGGLNNGMNAAHVLGHANFSAWAAEPSPIGCQTPYSPFYDSSQQRLIVSCRSTESIFTETNYVGMSNACPSGSALQICGSVTAVENGASLPGVPVELRDWQGKLVATQKTDGSGAYSFTNNLAAGGTYYVTPVVGRTQSASPMHFPIQNLPPIGTLANLSMRGWPGTLQVNAGTAGSFVLVSTAIYSGANAPTLNPSTLVSNFYTTIAKADGTASLTVPGGSYYVTCWQAQPSGPAILYTRSASSGAAYPVSANQVEAVGCP